MRRILQRRHAAITPAVLLALALAATACEDDEDILIIDPPDPVVGTVAAFADSMVDFGALHTFSMPDTVVHFAPRSGTALAVPRTFDQDILDQVRENLIARGYVEVRPDSVAPDFIVLVGATASEQQIAWVSYPWYSVWGFYDGFDSLASDFNASWSIVYPWGSAVTLTSYPRGTIVVDLIPRLSVNPLGRTVNSAWAGVATTILNGTTTSASITAAIDQMFTLSPYLFSDTPVVTPH